MNQYITIQLLRRFVPGPSAGGVAEELEPDTEPSPEPAVPGARAPQVLEA